MINQSPDPGTELYAGDSIHLYVSGVQEDYTILGNITGEDLSDAIVQLKSSGFSRVFVYMTESEDPAGQVVRQSPEPGELTAGDAAVELWVSSESSYAYSVDVAYNIEVEQSNSRVMVLYPSDGVYYVLYDTVLPSGQQTVPLTVRSNSSDPMEIILTVNGEEVRRETVTPIRRTESSNE